MAETSASFNCIEDGVAPKKVTQAGTAGKLQVYSAIGWIDLKSNDFGGVRNGCKYRIKPNTPALQGHNDDR